MRKLKMYVAVIVSFICVSTYFYKSNNTTVVNGNTALVIQHRLVYEDNVIKHYQEYGESKLTNEEQIVSILNSLKGTLLPYDSKIMKVFEDNNDLIIEVNESFFTLNQQDNLKIAEVLNYLRKLFYPSYTLRIYINNNELETIPQTSLLVKELYKSYLNLFNGNPINGYPVILMENDVLYTYYLNKKSDINDVTNQFMDSIMYDSFTTLPKFVEKIDMNNNEANVYLNNVLLSEEGVINEEILSDYLIVLFVNFDLDVINLYLNDEVYYYHGKDKQALKMYDIVYNLR